MEGRYGSFKPHASDEGKGLVSHGDESIHDAALSIADGQSAGEDWRHSRMDGYQGLSLRSRNQYQNPPYPLGTTVATGAPTAPAICAIVLLTVTVALSAESWAAV